MRKVFSVVCAAYEAAWYMMFTSFPGSLLREQKNLGMRLDTCTLMANHPLQADG